MILHDIALWFKRWPYQLTNLPTLKWTSESGGTLKTRYKKVSLLSVLPEHSTATVPRQYLLLICVSLCFFLFFFLFHLSVTRCLLVLLEWNLVPLITRRFQIWSSLLLSTPRWEGVIAIMQLRICNPRWSCNLKMKRRAWSCYGYDMKVLHDYLWSEFLLLRFQKKTFKENVSFGRRMAGKLI